MALEKTEFDIAAARKDILDGGEELVSSYANIGAVVLECTNMVPFSRALWQRLHLPIYDIRSFITWFQAGLDPPSFGLPGDRLWL
jgi:hypothetical protein